jgi:hypothetical protein
MLEMIGEPIGSPENGLILDLLEAYEINEAHKRGIHLLNDQLNLYHYSILNVFFIVFPS